jgi:lipopolysaccharide/colanic/teichoic acid biosynthesis glycosyltransferase
MKRLSDILFSILGLVLLLPFLFPLALIVLISSKGGVLYKQQRVGKRNIQFTMYKFRTMRTGSDKSTLITVGTKDPRVTAVGYYLRKYKLDELPQLLNVLLGDMSLVGPRPEVRKYVDMYTEEQLKVLSVKPGITDYASIEYSNESELLGRSSDPEHEYVNQIMPAKLELNIKYINEKSFLTDMKIILKTLAKIVQ